MLLIYLAYVRMRTLQRHNTQNSKQKELWGLSPNSTFNCLRAIYIQYCIPMIGLPILLQEMCGPILGIYKSPTDGTGAAQFTEKEYINSNYHFAGINPLTSHSLCR